MPIKKSSGLIFRKIRGRLVPISIKGKTEKHTSMGFIKQRVFTAKSGGEEVGFLQVGIKAPPKKSAEILLIEVNEKFQGVGVATAMFNRMMNVRGRAGNRKITGDLLHPAAAKVRKKVGKTTFEILSRDKSGNISTTVKRSKSMKRVMRAFEEKAAKKRVHIRASTTNPFKRLKKRKK